jgi:cytidine deaminase
MININQQELIAVAAGLARPFTPSPDCTSGSVASAIMTATGNVYTGVCIDTQCSLGFCAEAAAVAEMLKAHEAEIHMIVAVNSDGKVLPPCGRCRELLWQISPANRLAWIVLGVEYGKQLKDLLPDR